MTGEDRRIAWLLRREALDRGDCAVKGCLSAAAEAGFRVVAMDPSMATVDSGLEIESEAKRLGLHVVRVDEGVHCRLASVLDGAERRALSRALSQSGFEGVILCGGGDSLSPERSLFAAARALLRDLDQLDWESSH